MDKSGFRGIVVTREGSGAFRRIEAHDFSMRVTKDELDPPFEILEPDKWRGPVVFNSPHSGSVYPREFLAASRLELATLRRSEDSFVDELILGVLCRRQPRAL